MMKLKVDSTIPVWEHIFTITGIFIFSNAFREVDVIAGYWNYLRVLYYIPTFMMVALHLRRIVPISIKAPLMALLTILAVFSYIWSDNPGATLSRSIALIMMTLFSLYFAARYPLGSQLRILAVTMGIFAIISVIFALGLPEYGTQGVAWQGIFTQKNVFGRIMLIGAIVALTYPTTSKSARRWKLLSCIAFAVLIFLSESMTSLLILFVVVLLYFYLRILRLKSVLFTAFLFIGFIPSLFIFNMIANIDTDALLISLGKDPTLTGRAEVWQNLDAAIADRPLTGYGYGAFFNQWNGTYGELFSRGAAWAPGSAHNNYRDLWLNVGLGGVVLFGLSNIVLTIQGLIFVRRTKSADGMYLILMMVYFIILGFSESYALYTEVFWMLYVTTAFSLSGALVPYDEPDYKTLKQSARETQVNYALLPLHYPTT